MALSTAQLITLGRTIARACDVFEVGIVTPVGPTPDEAAADITAALTTIDSDSATTPKGQALEDSLRRVIALTTAPHIQAHAVEAGTWATNAAALL